MQGAHHLASAANLSQHTLGERASFGRQGFAGAPMSLSFGKSHAEIIPVIIAA